MQNIEGEQQNSNNIFLIEPQINHHSISYLTNKASQPQQKSNNIEIENQQSNSIFSQNKRNLTKYKEANDQIQYARTQHTPSHSNYNVVQPQFKVVRSNYGQNQDRQLPTQPNFNMPTITTQQHFYSQNTNAVHTQEAQQETNLQNYYDDFGDELEALGEIDDEELINNDDQQVPGQADQYYDEYDGPEQDINAEAITKPEQFANNYKNQDENSQNQKNKRRQLSQEPQIIEQTNISSFNKQNLLKQIPQQNERNQQIVSNGTAYIGQNSNTLEQETFSMQHDTFQGQVDAADMPDFSTQSQKQEEIEILHSNNKQVQTFPKKLLQQQKLVYSSNAQNKRMSSNSKINLYQKNAKQVKMMNRQRCEDNGVIYLVNNSAINYLKNDLQNDFDEESKQHQLVKRKFLDHKQSANRNEQDHSVVIQHITSHSQESDSAAPQTNENQILIIGNPNRYMKIKNNRKIKKKNSNGLTAEATIQSSKNNLQRDISQIIGLDTISQDDQNPIINYQGKQQTFMQQYNTYQDSRDLMMEAQNNSKETLSKIMDLQNRQDNLENQELLPKKSRSQLSQIPLKQQRTSASTQQILNTLNFQNSRALNHEIALNQMQKNLLEQFQRVKEMKRDAKLKKLRVEEDLKAFEKNKQELDEKMKRFKMKKEIFKKEKWLMKTENKKLMEVHQHYADLLKNKNLNYNGVYAPIEVSEKLNNIQIILEIVLKDQQHNEVNSQQSNSSRSSQTSASKIKMLAATNDNRQNQIEIQNNKFVNGEQQNEVFQKLRLNTDLKTNLKDQEGQSVKEQRMFDQAEQVPQLNYQGNISQQVYLYDQQPIQKPQQYQSIPQLENIVQQYQNKLEEMNEIVKNMQNFNPQLQQQNHFQQNRAFQNSQQVWQPIQQNSFQVAPQITQQKNAIAQKLMYQAQEVNHPNYNIQADQIKNQLVPSNLYSYEVTTHQPILTIGATPTETNNSSIDQTISNKIFIQQQAINQHQSQHSNLQIAQSYQTPVQGSFNNNYELSNTQIKMPMQFNQVIDNIQSQNQFDDQDFQTRNNIENGYLQQQENQKCQVFKSVYNYEIDNGYNQISQQQLVQNQMQQRNQPFYHNQSVQINQQVFQQQHTLNSKADQRKEQSTEVQSEFVFDPDPDFLTKINQNIRLNNQIIEEHEVKVPENQFVASPNKLVNPQKNQILNLQQNIQPALQETHNQNSHQQNQNQKYAQNLPNILIIEAEQQTQQNQEPDKQNETYLSQQLYLLQEQQYQHAYTDRNQLSSSQNSLHNFKDNLGQATQVDIMFQQQQARNNNATSQLVIQQQPETRNLQQISGGCSSQLSQIPSSQMSAFQSIQQKLKRIIGVNANQSNINQSSNIKENLTNNNYQSNFMYSNNGSQPDNTEQFNLKSYGLKNELKDSGGDYQIFRKQEQIPYSCNKNLNSNLQLSSTQHSPSLGHSPAALILKQQNNIKIINENENEDPIQLIDLEINSQTLKQNENVKVQSTEIILKTNKPEECKSQKKIKKIEEDEILRLIHESQEAQEWSESQSFYESSHTDTFHTRPKNIDFKPSETKTEIQKQQEILQSELDKNNYLKQTSAKIIKHLQNPSVEYNESGEIYDQPKKAIYGIKIAKNAF